MDMSDNSNVKCFQTGCLVLLLLSVFRCTEVGISNAGPVFFFSWPVLGGKPTSVIWP